MFDTGRTVGLLLLVQLGTGIATNFVLTAPLFAEPGFLTQGAVHSRAVGFSVFTALLASGITVGIAIIMQGIAREQVQLLKWLLVLASVGFGLAAFEQITMMSLVSYSQSYVAADQAGREILETNRVAVTAFRNWAHYLALTVSGCALFVYYLVLYLSNLVPRLLAGFGLLAVASQMMSVSMPFLGGEVVMAMLAPLALSQLLLSCWLIWNGFSAGAAAEADGRR